MSWLVILSVAKNLNKPIAPQLIVGQPQKRVPHVSHLRHGNRRSATTRLFLPLPLLLPLPLPLPLTLTLFVSRRHPERLAKDLSICFYRCTKISPMKAFVLVCHSEAQRAESAFAFAAKVGAGFSPHILTRHQPGFSP
ncbi:MAG: hypothetical protein P4L10_01590 [Acidobacteriaceae bacterium]|nr:hypothetical protein [Acidobacteriaceae bacterium]